MLQFCARVLEDPNPQLGDFSSVHAEGTISRQCNLPIRQFNWLPGVIQHVITFHSDKIIIGIPKETPVAGITVTIRGIHTEQPITLDGKIKWVSSVLKGTFGKINIFKTDLRTKTHFADVVHRVCPGLPCYIDFLVLHEITHRCENLLETRSLQIGDIVAENLLTGSVHHHCGYG